MAMPKAHDATKNSYWENYPEIDTPIVAEQLNRMETTMDTMDDRIIIHDSTKANQSDMLQAVKSITFNRATGVFKITFFNGTYVTIDTDLEKIAVNFRYDDDPKSPTYQQLILTLIDGTVQYIDLRALITQYEFLSSSTIQAIVGSDGTISFEVINGSITEEKLEPNFLANCRIEVGKAEQFSEESEAYAVGKRGGADVSPEDPTYHNNSLWYATQSSASAGLAVEAKENCAEILDQVELIVNKATFWVDFTSGELMYSDDAVYVFEINPQTGNLEWEVVDQ